MKLIGNLILFTILAFLYVYLAVNEQNYRILFMLPLQFFLGIFCFFIRPVWKSGLGMIVSIVFVYGIYIYQVIQGNQDPFLLVEAILPAFQSFAN